MILAIDQGTSGTTCLVVDEGLRVVGRGHRELARSFPRPGRVEQDPEAIWESALGAAAEALAGAGSRARDLTALGIANQQALLDRLHPDGPDLVAQARYAAEREWASDAEDVLLRRTTLAYRGLATPEARARVEVELARAAARRSRR